MESRKPKTYNEVYIKMLQSLPEQQRQFIWEELKEMARKEEARRKKTIEERKAVYLKDLDEVAEGLVETKPSIPLSFLGIDKEFEELERVSSSHVKLDLFLRERGY